MILSVCFSSIFLLRKQYREIGSEPWVRAEDRDRDSEAGKNGEDDTMGEETHARARMWRVTWDMKNTGYSRISKLLTTDPVAVRKKVLFLEKRRRAVK